MDLFTLAAAKHLSGGSGSGAPGKDGVGIKSIDKTGTEGLVDTYTITYTDGTTSIFQVTNGEDGKTQQSDWSQDDENQVDFIKNKPILQKDKMFFLPLQELRQQEVDSTTKVIKLEVTKGYLTDTDGIERYKIYINIIITPGYSNLNTGETTKVLDLPCIYGTSVGDSDIKNFSNFSLFLSDSTIFQRDVSIEEFIMILNQNYTVSSTYSFYSYDHGLDNKHFQQMKLRMNLNFYSEQIREAFYDEFIPVLNQIEYVCLKYSDYEEVETKYIGG